MMQPERHDVQEQDVIRALRGVRDPEIPIDVWSLGLIYGVRVESGGRVTVRMTLTNPHCPAAASVTRDVESAVREVEGVREARVELVWDPPWTAARMSEEAHQKLEL